MAKTKTVFFCSNCGNESPKWQGKCPACGEWNTYVEEVVSKNASPKATYNNMVAPKAKPQLLKDIELTEEPRIDTYNNELNRVLGGGRVPGSIVLLGGDPGIGKSTLVLQTVLQLKDKRTLYAFDFVCCLKAH